MPYTPIYAPRGNTLRSAGVSHTPSATFHIVASLGAVLGTGPTSARWYSSGRARIATDGEVGGSVAEFCRAQGWQWKTFDRRRHRACERIAAAKSARDSPDVKVKFE